MIRGIILDIETYHLYYVCRKYYMYKWTAHVLGNSRNFQCALGHNRSRRIKNSAFVK